MVLEEKGLLLYCHSLNFCVNSCMFKVRVPVGRLILELPAGMLDDDKGAFVGTAVREVSFSLQLLSIWWMCEFVCIFPYFLAERYLNISAPSRLEFLKRSQFTCLLLRIMPTFKEMVFQLNSYLSELFMLVLRVS